ncbi:related to elongation factor G [Cephalotrichum gorgonifer]|uniref:Related to elongation factor G n=1 Tax=Cephalotrichum gorgonifer TaxID=2041049 RepID=A0AAE8MTE8_9PEZI|nr:related to elongation factor G [Cephalotrichum gorgonifer]
MHASVMPGIVLRRGRKLRFTSPVVWAWACYSAPSRRGVHTPATQLPLGPHIKDIRNIGIIAHVDAGKTTTTERMLYCSGFSSRQGRVDEGSTVTDFLDLEREKGITIQSAAVTLQWPRHDALPPGTRPKTINLIDTPGHQDFRFEVDRCLPVLDGAVCIIDGVEGVEAHTERVWSSAQEHGIPRIVFVNKLDREGASFRRSVVDIGSRLNCMPVVCQIPWYEGENFVGVVDVLSRVLYQWGPDRKLTAAPVLPTADPELLKELRLARENMVAVLADHDELIMDMFLEDPDAITDQHLKDAMRRTIGAGDGTVVPVFAGASLRSIGVEPLLDAVIDYLPSPDERPEVVVTSLGKKLKLSEVLEKTVNRSGQQQLAAVSSVFKVTNHPKEGLLAFVRVYGGQLAKNSAPWNTHALQTEKPMGMVQIEAEKTHNVDHLSAGQIGALRGLKFARTGDTLVSAVGHKGVPEPAKHIMIRPAEIPPPVAFLAIDPFGLVAANELQTALQNTSREDPSLRWSRDERTDQFIIQGMGKLHLDVTVHELKRRYKIDAAFGDIEVDYKEHLTYVTPPHTATFDRALAGKTGSATCTVVLGPIEAHHRESVLESTVERDGNMFHIKIPLPEGSGSLPFNPEEARQQLLNGAIAGLARGPRRGSPVHGCHVTIEVDLEGTKTPTGGHFSGASRRAVSDALKGALAASQVAVLEPIMRVVISCPEAVAGTVQHDISSAAGGHVLEVKDLSSGAGGYAGEGSAVDVSKIYAPADRYEEITTQRERVGVRRVQITARVPFKEVIGYDGHLRSKTGGRHSMTMAFDSLAKVTGFRDRKL